MDELLPWLEDCIASQLAEADTWLQQTGGKSVAEVCPARFVSNGSVLWILDITDKNHYRYLAITQHKPLLLADGAVSIQADVAPECHPSIAALRQGLSIAVRNFTIQYTPYGPTRRRLQLILNRVEYGGAFSKDPRPESESVIASPKVAEQLRELGKTWAELDRRQTEIICQCSTITKHKLEEGGDMAQNGREGEEAGNAEGSPSTQMAYHTQMLHRMRGPSDATETPANRPSKNTDDDAQKATLLSLLYRGGDSSKPPSAGGFKRPYASDQPKGNLERPTDRIQPAPMPPPYTHKSNAEKAPASVVRNTGKSSATRTSGNRTNATPSRASQSQSDEDALEEEDTVPAWLQNTYRGVDCGKVPSSQQVVLSRKESWQQHRSGTSFCFPDANIPIGVLDKLKEFKMHHTSTEESSSSEEDESTSPEGIPVNEEDESASPEGIPVNEENGALSEEDDESLASWSSSPEPEPEPPKQPSRPGLTLPPDSSLSQGANSLFEPKETSSSQQAQRVVNITSSNEDRTMNPPSSPPFVPNGNDSDIDMEVDVPPVVQVKETPYAKGKSVGFASVTFASTQAQQHSSSGTSKDTSSTSIVYCTYKEPNSPGKANVPDEEAASSITGLHLTSHDCRGENAKSNITAPSRDVIRSLSTDRTPFPLTEPEDVIMGDEQDEPLFHSNIASRLVRGPKLAQDQKSHSEPPQLSSAQIPPSAIGAVDDTVPVKRKLQSPLSKNGRPPKRVIRYRAFSPIRDIAEQLQKEREGTLERLRESARAQSVASNATDNDAKAGAQSAASPMPQGPTFDTHEAPANLTSSQIIDADVHRREQYVLKDEGISHGCQASHAASEPAPLRVGSADGDLQPAFLPGNDAGDLDQSRPLGTLAAPKNPPKNSEEVEMEPDNVDDDVTMVDAGGIGKGNTGDDDIEDAVTFEDAEFANAEADKSGLGNTAVDEDDTGNADPDNAVNARDTFGHPPASSTHPSAIGSVPVPPAVAPTVTHEPTTTQAHVPATIFERFKATYPVYTGDARHFLGQCKQMEKLDSEDKMVPKWLWDDYIIRRRTDYRDYLNECLDSSVDPEPYHRFFKDNLQDNLYTEKIIGSRRTLIAAIEELEGRGSAGSIGTDPPASRPAVARTSSRDTPAPRIFATEATGFEAPIPKGARAKAAVASAHSRGTEPRTSGPTVARTFSRNARAPKVSTAEAISDEAAAAEGASLEAPLPRGARVKAAVAKIATTQTPTTEPEGDSFEVEGVSCEAPFPKVARAKAVFTKIATGKAPTIEAAAPSGSAKDRLGLGQGSSLGSARKPRQSLPSAFGKKITGKAPTTEAAAPSGSEKDQPGLRQGGSLDSARKPRQSLPSAFSKKITGSSTSAKQASHPSTATGVSPRPSSSVQRTSSKEREPPVLDEFTAFCKAHPRTKAFTGSQRVDPDRRVKWPHNLHVRPVAEVKRKGYDVLEWTDDL